MNEVITVFIASFLGTFIAAISAIGIMYFKIKEKFGNNYLFG